MLKHFHILTCDDDWDIYYDFLQYDYLESINTYLNFAAGIFELTDISKEKLKNKMIKMFENKSENPVYFQAGYFLYLWIQCDNCKLSSLN